MSQKARDERGRWRNKTVAFRMSEEENRILDTKVSLSGLTKQDYIIRQLLGWRIEVQANPRVYKALRNQMKEILEQLCRITAGETIDPDLVETIWLVADTLNEVKGKDEEEIF
jgi:hypothetical protein